MYTHKECYKILQIDKEISWSEFRKTYKKQIQKWHPDRFTDAIKKSSAEDKIKELNIAFVQLSQYYKKNGSFPEIEPQAFKTNREARSQQPHEKSEDNSQSSPGVTTTEPAINVLHNSPPVRKKATTSLLTFAILAGVMSYILLNNESENAESTEPDRNTSNNLTIEHPMHNEQLSKAHETPIKPDNKNPVKEDPIEPIPRYFTYGSTIGEVLSIQGPPDYTEGSFWFYGDSYVEFENGVVKDWKRSPNNPLNANINL